jgi:ABC-2 type transport system ATP-binding protein
VIHAPDLVVLDEPFSGLDPVNARLLQELILEQRDRGATVVLSTHQMEQVEAMCESICLIHNGQPVLSGQLTAIKASYGRNTLVVEYVGPSGLLRGIPGVQECADTGRLARLQLEPGADAQRVIRAVLDRVEVRMVKLDEPRIEDIYLEKVGARPSPAAPGAEV